jgi:predicted metal-dependent phosphoesterase TrpH
MVNNYAQQNINLNRDRRTKKPYKSIKTNLSASKEKKQNHHGLIDLHVHTQICSSDSTLTVPGVLKTCKEKNIGYLAITNHNDIRHTKKAIRLVKNMPHKYAGLHVITGLEINCSYHGIKQPIHMLMYDFDVENEKLNQLLNKIKKEELAVRTKLFSAIDKAFGIKFSSAEILKAPLGNFIDWEQIAQMAVLHKDENGNPAPYARSVDEFLQTIPSLLRKNTRLKPIADDLLLNTPYSLIDEPLNITIPTMYELIDLAKECSADLGFAHPSLIDFDKKINYDKQLDALLYDFSSTCTNKGVQGVLEVCYGQSNNEEEKLLNFAKKYSLIPTGGSDAHRDYDRIGLINDYNLKKLPYIHYLNNDKRPDAIIFPKRMSDCMVPVANKIIRGYVKNFNLKQKSLKKQRLEQVALATENIGTSRVKLDDILDRNNGINNRKKLVEQKNEVSEIDNYCAAIWNDHYSKKEFKRKLPELEASYCIYKSKMTKYGFLYNGLKNDTVENLEEFKAVQKKHYNSAKSNYTKIQGLRSHYYKIHNIQKKEYCFSKSQRKKLIVKVEHNMKNSLGPLSV